MERSAQSTLQEGGAAFEPTHWTVVQLASQSGSPESARALEDFCLAYWPPLYTFLRRRGYSSEDAQDFTQGFFAHLLNENTLSRADRAKGRLRTFLLGALQHFLSNERDRARTLKRGGGQRFLAIHEHLAEAEATLAGSGHLDDTGSYDQAWATTLVSRAWETLRQTLATEGQLRWLEELEPFLTGTSATPPDPQETAARLGVSVHTLRSALRRLRERYREALRSEVARTVTDPAEVEAEMSYLFQLLLA